ncbi:MAG: YIP1 family protein [Deltaproteobacteria bacterium]|nr:YIP1 family protein [Deltaproteobacteria bacterium]
MNEENGHVNEQNNHQSEGPCCCKLPSSFDKEAILAKLKSISERAMAVLTNPAAIWTTIREEQVSIKDVYMNYLIFMAAIPAVCEFVGGLFKGVPFFSSLIGHAVLYLLGLAGIWLTAIILEKLAVQFEGSAEFDNTFKLVAYSLTPFYVAGFLALVQVPFFAVLRALLSLYGAFILFKGIGEMTSVPAEKQNLYYLFSLLTPVVILAILVTVSWSFI